MTIPHPFCSPSTCKSMQATKMLGNSSTRLISQRYARDKFLVYFLAVGLRVAGTVFTSHGLSCWLACLYLVDLPLSVLLGPVYLARLFTVQKRIEFVVVFLWQLYSELACVEFPCIGTGGTLKLLKHVCAFSVSLEYV